MDASKIIPGKWAKYKNSWGYIVSINNGEIWLSDWYKIKTVIAKIKDIQEIRNNPPKKR